MAKSNARGAEAAPTNETSVPVLRDFKTLTEKMYQPSLAKILLCCQRNPYKVPDETVLAPCQTNYAAYVQARTDRDANPTPANVELVRTYNRLCNSSFDDLAEWVGNNSNGDRAVAKSYGFNVASETRTRASKLPAPENIAWKYGDSGEIIFSCTKLADRVQYIMSYSTDNGQTFVRCGESSKSYSIPITGLTPGKAYIFRLFGKNSAGEGMATATRLIYAV